MKYVSEPLKRAARFKFYLKSDKRCAKCRVEVRFGGRTRDPYEFMASGHIDHIVPRVCGGGNEESNLQLLCISCNCSKGAKLEI